MRGWVHQGGCINIARPPHTLGHSLIGNARSFLDPTATLGHSLIAGAAACSSTAPPRPHNTLLARHVARLSRHNTSHTRVGQGFFRDIGVWQHSHPTTEPAIECARGSVLRTTSQIPGAASSPAPTPPLRETRAQSGRVRECRRDERAVNTRLISHSALQWYSVHKVPTLHRPLRTPHLNAIDQE